MLLLNICAVTGNNMVIQVGLAFLLGEKESDYNWAIDYMWDIMAEHSIEEPSSIVIDRELALMWCLDTRFPGSQHILCRWYINMNVLAKTKRWFPAPVRVNGIIQRHSQFQDFIRSWNTLLASPTEQIYNQKLAEMQTKYPIGAVRYYTDTWLLWKENLVACYINQHYHFGVTVTSPIEGWHASLKAYL
jgi:MULE transposase domain